MRHAQQHPQLRLRVDPVACDGIGMCAHLASGIVTVDSWGYPIVPRRPLTRRERAAADAAVSGCPRRALFLQAEPTPAASTRQR